VKKGLNMFSPYKIFYLFHQNLSCEMRLSHKMRWISYILSGKPISSGLTSSSLVFYHLRSGCRNTLRVWEFFRFGRQIRPVGGQVTHWWSWLTLIQKRIKN